MRAGEELNISWGLPFRMQAGDYKTGRAYGERPPMVIAPAINPEVSPPPLTWDAHLSDIRLHTACRSRARIC